MPRSVPTIDGSPNFYRVSFKYIDAVGDLRSDSVEIPQVAYSDVNTEAYIVAQAAVTNADLYEVEVKAIYKALPQKSNATNAIRVAVDDNIVNLLKSVFNDTSRQYIPSPIAALFVTGTEQVNTTNALLNTMITAFDVMIEGAAAQFTWISSRFTERREINEAQKP